MKTWTYEIGDTLSITYRGKNRTIEVSSFYDVLDDRKPLYGRLLLANGQYSENEIPVRKSKIIGRAFRMRY